MQTIEEQLEEAQNQPEPVTPEALAQLESDTARVKAMQPEDVKQLFGESLLDVISNYAYSDDDSPLQLVDWYVKKNEEVKWEKAASWTRNKSQLRTGVLNSVFDGGTFVLHKTDVSASVEMGFEFGGSIDEGFKAYPCSMFSPLYIMTYKDGSRVWRVASSDISHQVD